MSVRPVTTEDLLAVSKVCMAAFNATVAPALSEEGIATFTRLATADAFGRRVAAGHEVLVFDDAGTIRGVAELKQGRHLAMLFVAPGSQKQGIGRALVATVIARAEAAVVTVHASLNSVPAYTGYGFIPTGGIVESDGLKYQPMEMRRE